jgi:S-adenosylmethionine decarboxylase
MSTLGKPITPTNLDVTLSGLHVIANFESDNIKHLEEFSAFQGFIDTVIEDLKLNKVGEAYHNFDGGGFTGVVCLSESHLSIHTWPKRNYVTFDVFLSNFLQDNAPKAELIYKETLNFFAGRILFEKSIKR